MGRVTSCPLSHPQYPARWPPTEALGQCACIHEGNGDTCCQFQSIWHVMNGGTLLGPQDLSLSFQEKRLLFLIQCIAWPCSCHCRGSRTRTGEGKRKFINIISWVENDISLPGVMSREGKDNASWEGFPSDLTWGKIKPRRESKASDIRMWASLS